MGKKRLAWWQIVRHGALTIRFDGRVTCHVCGVGFHNLALHVKRVHKLTTADYCQRFGLPVGTSLVSAEGRARHSKGARESPLMVVPRRPDDIVLILDGEDTSCCA